jgi:hypothetical protein
VTVLASLSGTSRPALNAEGSAVSGAPESEDARPSLLDTTGVEKINAVAAALTKNVPATISQRLIASLFPRQRHQDCDVV